ncbi:transcriptional repressor general negative regulator of transcription subunit 4 [Tulasnella sp. 331]|nr:transcriptional repressor general negative regulator of transcription subunit 4 [Tulasnella sp. 331]
MASTRTATHSHHPHAPTSINGGHGLGSIFSQKSHVVAGVQDAYWSDDEEEGTECPLCVSEMDMDDLNFKPCPCGYQLCRFCYHHIKENLNGRCPACRREYSDDAVEWKAMSSEDQKRLIQQKKQKEKEKKELEVLKRAHLPNMRVVQRNVVYVTGLGPKYAKEELIPSLRSHEYFGQYGKISKIVLVKRSGTANREPTTGLYITYNRREDAARAISGVDGSPSPGGGGQVMRASYGTTKYCMTFLRNATCTNQGCRELHEWGDDKDSFTKEDLTTLKHAMKDSENRQKFVVAKEADSLPHTASWAKISNSPRLGSTVPVAVPFPTQSQMRSSVTRPARTRQTSSQAVTPRGGPVEPTNRTARNQESISLQEKERDKEREKSGQDRRGHTHSSSSGSTGAASVSAAVSSGPAPGTTPTPIPMPMPASTRSSVRSPGTSRSSTPAVSSLPSRPSTAADGRNSTMSLVKSPPQASARPVQPSLSPPPRQVPMETPVLQEAAKATPPPPTSHKDEPISTPSTLEPPVASNSYQPSSQAQALLDDVRARRESTANAYIASPFPDLDRTLAALNSSDFSFSFNIDPTLASKLSSTSINGKGRQSPVFKGSFDPFASAAPAPMPPAPQLPASLPPPPGLGVRPSANHTQSVAASPGVAPERQQSLGIPSRYGTAPSSYSGSFDPFAEISASSPTNSLQTQQTLFEEESRRASRFGFARRGGGTDGMSSRFGASAASSPLGASDGLPQTPLYASSDVLSPVPSSSSQQLPQWTLPVHQDYGPPPGMSPMLYNNGAINRGLQQHQQQQTSSMSSMDSFSPFGTNGDMSLKEMLNIGRHQSSDRRDLPMQGFPQSQQQHPFNDPAIMSMRMSEQAGDQRYPNGFSNGNMQMRPPPGLAPMPPPGLQRTAPQQRTHQPIMALPSLSTTIHDRAQPFIHTKATDLKPKQTDKSHPTPVVTAQSLPSKEKGAKGPQRQKTGSVTHPSPDINFSLPPTPAVAAEAFLHEDEGETGIGNTSNNLLKPREVPLPTQPVLSRREKRILAKKQAKPPSTATNSAMASPHPASPPALHLTVSSQGSGDTGEIPSLEPAQKQSQTPVRVVVPKPQPLLETAPTSKSQAPSITSSSHMPAADYSTATAEPVSQSRNSSMNDKVNDADHAEPKSHLSAPESALEGQGSTPITQFPNNADEPTLSRKERKIMAAKAAQEAAAERAREAAKAKAEADKAVNAVVPIITSKMRSIENMLLDIKEYANVDLMAFFDPKSINPKPHPPLPYSPLVRALSALSLGNGAFVDNTPSSNIDSAVSSFQTLLETLTQTISDLLRLLPRTTWTDSSSFDGVLHEMLKADDFVKDPTEETSEHDDEVAALTLALERRAKWMEVQLAKLEELHRDINNAAVRAVLTINDRGWDAPRFLPRGGGSLARFETLGKVEAGDSWRPMTLTELEMELQDARFVENAAEVELKRAMRVNLEYI